MTADPDVFRGIPKGDRPLVAASGPQALEQALRNGEISLTGDTYIDIHNGNPFPKRDVVPSRAPSKRGEMVSSGRRWAHAETPHAVAIVTGLGIPMQGHHSFQVPELERIVGKKVGDILGLKKAAPKPWTSSQLEDIALLKKAVADGRIEEEGYLKFDRTGKGSVRFAQDDRKWARIVDPSGAFGLRITMQHVGLSNVTDAGAVPLADLESVIGPLGLVRDEAAANHRAGAMRL